MNIKRLIYSLYFFDVKFEKGFSYKRINSSDLDLLEAYDFALKHKGFERITEVKATFFSAHIWYKKPKANTNGK